MALLLRLRKSEDVLLGAGVRMILERIVSPDEIVVEVIDEKGLSKKFTITDDMNKEIYPEIRLSLGNTGDYTTAQCLFEAPRSIRIMRGDLIRREPDNVHTAKLCVN